MSEELIRDPSEWERIGRGRELQFYAADKDLDRYLRGLPAEFAPFGIVGTTLIKRERLYQHQAFGLALEEWLVSVRDRSQPPLTNYWLWSGTAPRVIPNDGVEGWCAVNGFILLQHGRERDGKREVSRIAHVERVIHLKSGQVHAHTRQAAIFRALRNAIKRDLVFATMHDFKDGRLAEDDRARLMTAAAAELASAGFFDRVPGRRLR